MRQRRLRWSLRAALAGLVGAMAFAALAAVGAAVSPSGKPAASEQYPEKVTICHRTGSKKNPFRTIRVSKNAEAAHLRHGDTVGPCPTATFVVCHEGEKTTKVKGAKAAAKHLRHGDKLGKCKKPKNNQTATRAGSQKGKSSSKGGKAEPNTGKAKPSTSPAKAGTKGKPADTPGNGGDKGKPADTPGNGGDKGKPADTPGNGGDKGNGPKK